MTFIQSLHRLVVIGTLVGSLSLVSSCTCVTCGDDDSMALDQPWPDSLAALEQRIIGLHATGQELIAVTGSEFVRYNSQMKLIERRPLVRTLANLGQPAMNDFIYARAVREIGTGEEFVQFSLVQNAGATELISVDSVSAMPITLLTSGESIGAFNAAGTIYLQPVLRRDTRRVALLKFAIEFSPTFTRINSLKYLEMIDLPNVRDIEGAVSSVNYLEGAFYLATKFGAYRVTDQGLVSRLTPENSEIRDIFKYDRSFYATQSSAGIMFSSEDGITWASSGIPSTLRLVQVFGTTLISHQFAGWQWEITDDIAKQVKSLAINENFAQKNDLYYALVRFDGKYYLSVDRTIYIADELMAKE